MPGHHSGTRLATAELAAATTASGVHHLPCHACIVPRPAVQVVVPVIEGRRLLTRDVSPLPLPTALRSG
jgi:hypothetical protein